jgi:type I restriction-modification system DNA methylase subunit
MPKFLTDIITTYLHKVKTANKEMTKKEAFKDLLNRLYAGEKDIERIIDKITGGAEATVLNIPREDKLHRGSADTLYNKIIIEFEKDLKLTLKHAKEQLAGYLLGQFNSGEGYNFTLIATDCITWKVFAPDVSQLDKLESLTESELILNEVESASIVLTEKNAEDFFYWIDRFLFKEEKQRATLKRIEESFGYQSNVFIESFRELSRHFSDVKKYGEVQVSLEQWKKFLSIAYGTFDASEENFLIHTYLSVFSKMLAYAVVSNDDYIDEEEMKGILVGSIFHKYNIQNFIDNDFFHWVVAERNFRGLKKVFRLISQEISAYDFNNVDEDVLKGVYQELIDLDTRHALGEYYTPDWLCERIVKEFDFTATDKILDPACGSGSFLRAAIHRVKEMNPEITVEELNNNIYGIDIHPLSVQIAKTTMLLALGKEVTTAKKPIHLNIIMANTLLAPEGIMNLFGGEFTMTIDKVKLLLNTQMFDNVHLFDQALDVCESLADQTMNKKKESIESFEATLKRRYNKGGFNGVMVESFYKIYETLKHVKERGRDGIWKFIVQNLYKPYFLNKTFNFIIGNPPWFTYSSIKNEEYQDQLNMLADKYAVKPERVANFPHLEIAAIFMSHCCSYFLNENGKLAFVLPRSFFSADHHDNTRKGTAKGFRLTQIWDMDKVSPLFRIPSCVLFAGKTEGKRNFPASGVDGISFSGRIPVHNCNYDIAGTKLTETFNKWYYIKLGHSSAFSTRKAKAQTKGNPYKSQFKQGATIVPRAFYFIQLDMDYAEGWQKDFDWKDRILNIKTSDAAIADAKRPWRELNFSGRMESNFIFRTALSKSILPFALFRPDLVVLPVIIESDNASNKKINLLTADELMQDGYMDAARWFKNAERIWEIHRTEKNRSITLEKYLNWQNKLTAQNLNARYLVLYNSSAKDANSVIIRREDFDLEFFVESVTYVFFTDVLEEAFYITSILNSSVSNLAIKDFQAKGLFGARHVHKKILDVYFPKFDESDPKHLQLAHLGKEAHEKVKLFLANIPPTQKVKGNQLGRIRLEIKRHLEKEMKEIDGVVRGIVG